VSDPSGTVATPLIVLEAPRVFADGRELVRLVEDYEVELIVVGLPLSLDGGEGPQAARVRAASSRLAEFLPVPMVFCDERLSSAEANRAMATTGASERDRRGSVDMVAATIFLQGYLDAGLDDRQIGADG
jgi:putative Holliday junction resolvase